MVLIKIEQRNAVWSTSVEPLSYAVLGTSSFLFFNSILVPVPAANPVPAMFSSLLDLDPSSKQQAASSRKGASIKYNNTADCRQQTCRTARTADSSPQTAVRSS
jgi:hypothetical protein